MKTRMVANTVYEVWHKNGGCRLSSSFGTKLEAYEALKETVIREKGKGYKADDYIIVEVKFGREFTDDGEFVSSFENNRIIYTSAQINGFLEQGL